LPRYSIITVCLNAKEDLKKTLHSIEKQTFHNFEWIVIDGKSTDGTVDILRHHPLVAYLLSEPDDGIYDAMNKGIKLATGDYFLFLNAGDSLYNKTTLQDVDKHLTGDLVIGCMMCILFDKNKQKKNSLRRFYDRDIGKEYLYNRTLPHQSTFVKREIFDKYGGYCKTFKIKGDHDFFSRIIVRGVKFSFLSFCVAIYPLNGVSHQMKKSKLVCDELCLVRRRNYSMAYRIKVNVHALLDSLALIFNRLRQGVS
jgi:glycosyltransferase involved in cell wall biosynthesis